MSNPSHTEVLLQYKQLFIDKLSADLKAALGTQTFACRALWAYALSLVPPLLMCCSNGKGSRYYTHKNSCCVHMCNNSFVTLHASRRCAVNTFALLQQHSTYIYMYTLHLIWLKHNDYSVTLFQMDKYQITCGDKPTWYSTTGNTLRQHNIFLSLIGSLNCPLIWVTKQTNGEMKCHIKYSLLKINRPYSSNVICEPYSIHFSSRL